MKFSERMGLTQMRTIIQTDSINDKLRTRIWNNFLEDFFNRIPGNLQVRHMYKEKFLTFFWTEFLVKNIDEIPRYTGGNIDEEFMLATMKGSLFNCEWFEVYEFVEFIAPISQNFQTSFSQKLNISLEKELSAYRLVNNIISRLTSELEISSIEEAIANNDEFKSVQSHIKQALEYLSNRQKPDYRNSIKESISAVEALSKILVKNKKGTLNDALAILEKQKDLNPTLKKSFSILYGYTSDAGGIRHSLKDGDTEIDYEEAKFMLVACSAFINYLKAKFPIASP